MAIVAMVYFVVYKHCLKCLMQVLGLQNALHKL